MKAFGMTVMLILAVTATALGAGVDDLQNASVTISAGGAQGSGTMFCRNGHTFIWTAGHVVDGLRHSREVVDGKGSRRTIFEFEDPSVIQEFSDSGRKVGETKLLAKVLRYSDSSSGDDIALLLVRKHGEMGPGVKFYLDNEIPQPGTELYHVGSLLGQIGSNSLTTGIVSQVGRVLETRPGGAVFDQTTVTAFPGSSGGGVYLKKDYRYVGMLVRGAGEQFNMIVPVRRLRHWAEATNCSWALDPAVKLPNDYDQPKFDELQEADTARTAAASANPDLSFRVKHQKKSLHETATEALARHWREKFTR